MENFEPKKQGQNVGSKLPDLKNMDEVRKAVIASEILQRKW